jgi:hypothetical protein
MNKQKLILGLITFGSFVYLAACSTKPILQSERSKDLGSMREYEKALHVKVIPTEAPTPTPVAAVGLASPIPTLAPTVSPSPTPPKQKAAKASKITPTPTPKKFDEVFRIPLIGPRQPDIEVAEGFEGRRPVVDPFKVGQKVVLNLSYYNVVAGQLTIETLPFVEVNGRKAYHFRVAAKSSDLFSKFYAVDDYAETFVDYETMLPFNYEIHVRESKQLREIRSFIDWKDLKCKYWEQKITQEWGTENKELEWAVLPYSQNVFSAVYYLRTFALKPNMEVQMRVADEGRNMIVKGAVVRKEKLKTDIGEFDTIVMRPEIQMQGVFQPVGEILFWITDDEHKQIVRLESKIKIGKILGTLKAIEKGSK